jgi:hypothetical protein
LAPGRARGVELGIRSKDLCKFRHARARSGEWVRSQG